ncbi:MAG: hypothetical protein PHT12_04450 [Patescibacteria group bacterium]|nr:hypothetical protein [Patescibacteria group bacterium]
MKHTNETITITIGSPLLRPGLTLSTQVSSKYLLPALTNLLDQVRQFNQQQGEPKPESK